MYLRIFIIFSLFVITSDLVVAGTTPTSMSASTKESSTVTLSPGSASNVITPTPSIREKELTRAANMSVTGTMKDHFRSGMRYFMKGKYAQAIPELEAATMIVDPYTWGYWYAEAYAILGVIYEFHSQIKNHRKLALKYYRIALKYDPKTKSAKYFLPTVENHPNHPLKEKDK